MPPRRDLHGQGICQSTRQAGNWSSGSRPIRLFNQYFCLLNQYPFFGGGKTAGSGAPIVSRDPPGSIPPDPANWLRGPRHALHVANVRPEEGVGLSRIGSGHRISSLSFLRFGVPQNQRNGTADRFPSSCPSSHRKAGYHGADSLQPLVANFAFCRLLNMNKTNNEKQPYQQ